MNLIFDIGGILIDDNKARLQEFLGLSDETFAKFYQDVYHNPEWMAVILGNLSYQEHFYRMSQEFPIWRDFCLKIAAPESNPYIVPILQDNVDYILRIKDSGKYKVYLLSNIADATYYYLHDIIAKFDGGVYSFIEHLRKPEERFYQVLLERYNLEPSTCLFFDDRQINIDAGEKLGIKGIKFSSLDDLKAQELL